MDRIVIKTSWSELKHVVETYNLSIQETDFGNYYVLTAAKGPILVQHTIQKTDPASEDQADYETNFQSSANAALQQEVITLFEKNDKDLKCASTTAPVDPDTGEVILTIPVGATGRFVDAGELFFTSEEPRRVLEIGVAAPATGLPENALYPGSPAMPPGYVIKAYHDDDLPIEYRGWRVPATDTHGPVGILDVETLAGYGFIPEGLALHVKAKMPGTAPFSGWATCNVKWGKLG